MYCSHVFIYIKKTIIFCVINKEAYVVHSKASEITNRVEFKFVCSVNNSKELKCFYANSQDRVHLNFGSQT